MKLSNKQQKLRHYVDPQRYLVYGSNCYQILPTWQTSRMTILHQKNTKFWLYGRVWFSSMVPVRYRDNKFFKTYGKTTRTLLWFWLLLYERVIV